MNNNKPYSSSDIQRYISGQMSAVEMNAFEKVALEDPFLADAIEGYAENTTHRKVSAQKDLEELQHRLKNRLSDNHKIVAVPLFKWWKVAVVFILLAGAGVWVYTLTNPNQKNETLAKNEAAMPVQPIEDTLTNDIISLNEPGASVKKEDGEQPLVVTGNRKRAEDKAGDEETIENDQSITSGEKEVLRDDKPEQSLELNDVKQKSVITETSAVSRHQAAAPSVEENAPKTFSGKIVDENNQPVPFATVLVINSQLDISADSDGYFDFSFNDSIATVDVRGTGFESARATLKTGLINTEIKLKLRSDTNEAVVVAYGVRSKTTRKPPASITGSGIEPVSGWNKYNRYIAKNKKMPAGKRNLQADVVLSFALDNNGRPAQIKIEKSASPAINAEAIRLLQEGAAWKNNQQTRAVVTIRL